MIILLHDFINLNSFYHLIRFWHSYYNYIGPVLNLKLLNLFVTKQAGYLHFNDECESCTF